MVVVGYKKVESGSGISAGGRLDVSFQALLSLVNLFFRALLSNSIGSLNSQSYYVCKKEVFLCMTKLVPKCNI